MKLDMSRDELKKLLLYAPQREIDEVIDDIHPADILDVIHELDALSVLKILNRIPEWLIAEVIDEEEDEEKYALLVNFSENKQKNILKEMSSDEIADLLGSLDESESKRILDNMTVDEAEDVKQLLNYAPDTAGGIMATEYIAIKENMTVKETLKYLQKEAPNAESAYYLYVVDEQEKLKGVVSLREIVVSAFNTIISDILNSKVISVHCDMDQEEVAQRFDKYGFLTMPVVNDEDKMLGIVTVDDIIEVLRDETTEDIHRLGGLDEGEKVAGTVLESVKSRLPWLLVNLLTAMLASATVSMFEGTISKVVILATFMPIVAGMGGNAGTQTLTLVVRGLALGELTFDNAKKIFFKEIGVGLTNGLSVGIAISIIGGVWAGKPIFGLVIGLAMVMNMTVATMAGFLVPLTLKKLKIDPALASAVFVTTATDVLGFFFFLGLATMFIQYLI